jgi:2-polyprenyl-6-methoxyphenol hydroxylase-like FAD-dependent oxidoreductase
VALVERRPDPAAFKRICSHLIQASAVPAIERLGLLEPMLAAGAVRSRAHIWTRWGWIEAPPERAGYAINLRRERLDPLVRETAAAVPGVELCLGLSAERLLREDGAFRGVVACDREGAERALRGKLVIGADGRDSQVAELAKVKIKTRPHNRFVYGAYYQDAVLTDAPDASLWFLDPDVAAAFPTDDGFTFIAAMPTKTRLPEFRRDPEAALVSFISALPKAPKIGAGQRVGPMLGKLEMPNRSRGPVAPGLALIGDAALAIDPLFGVGCGWAFQSAEWLTEALAPALVEGASLERGLARYRRRHRRELRWHAWQIHDYATGHRFTRSERVMLAAAARDPEMAARFDAFATRQVNLTRAITTVVPRALVLSARQALGRGR